MEASVNVTRKVRVSKNRKKGWKKHSNIDEVEEFLEEQRADERQGGPIESKKDESLFFVDKTTQDIPSEALALRTRKRKRHDAPLKSLRSLENSSSVLPPAKPYQIQTVSKKQPRKKLSKKVPVIVKPNVDVPKEKYDLWADEPVKDETEELAKQIMSYQFAKVPSHRYQKPSLLPAVEPPHPGASYNPSSKDHQSLIMAAAEVEYKKQRQEDHLDRVLRKKFPTADQAPTVESWIEEMSQGLVEESSSEEEEENDEAPVIKTWGKRIDRETRKITVQRNAEKAEKRRLKILEEEKLKKKLRNDFQRIKQMKKEIFKKELVSLERQKKRDEIKLNSLYRPHRLGKEKYVDPDMEVNLTEELRGSLRKVKMEGNILEDRFRSLQKRNIIEPRSKKTLKRKFKLKKQVKRSHRDAQLEIDKLLRNTK